MTGLQLSLLGLFNITLDGISLPKRCSQHYVRMYDGGFTAVLLHGAHVLLLKRVPRLAFRMWEALRVSEHWQRQRQLQVM